MALRLLPIATALERLSERLHRHPKLFADGREGGRVVPVNDSEIRGVMDANTSRQTFPCFMQCCAADPSTDSSYVSARLKIGPHEMACAIVDQVTDLPATPK